MQTSKKHYIAVSKMLRPFVETGGNPKRFNPEKAECAYNICLKLAEIYQADNSQFDKARFLAACGFEAWQIEVNK